MKPKIEREEKISKWDARFYHIYSDEKRVKEISVETARKHIKTNRKIVAVSKSWINFWSEQGHIGVSKRQLQAILNDLEEC